MAVYSFRTTLLYHIQLRSYLIFRNKKCRIYAACGVSQTPNLVIIHYEEDKYLKKELIIVIDFGGQYNQLVARRVRECNVYCEIYSYKIDIEKIKEMNPKGIILTGGPNSCYLRFLINC